MGDFIKAAHSKDGKQAFVITKIVRDAVAGHRTDEAGEETTESIGVVEKYVGTLVDLETGRHHQIRLQMSNIGHALYGDQRYGLQDKKQIALYAYKLEFIHPVTKEEMSFKLLPKNEGVWKLIEGVKL